MAAKATDFTYHASESEVAAMQVYVDAYNASGQQPQIYGLGQLPPPPATVEDFFTAFVGNQAAVWVSLARTKLKDDHASAFNTLPVESQHAMLQQMGVTTDPALLVYDAPPEPEPPSEVPVDAVPSISPPGAFV